MLREELASENSENSYLVETTFDSDIDVNMREEIEKKYRNSKINQSYVFPRRQRQRQKHSVELGKRNVSTQRHNPCLVSKDRSCKQQEICKIYSREQVVLKQM